MKKKTITTLIAVSLVAGPGCCILLGYLGYRGLPLLMMEITVLTLTAVALLLSFKIPPDEDGQADGK